ncbi:MAG: trigger factor [Patescibacteria group bacterium]
MEIEIRKFPHNLVELTIKLEAAEFDKFLKKAEEKLLQETQIPGFRPGKVPLEILKREIGETKIYEEASKMAIAESYWQAIKEKGLEPISLPKIEILKIARHNPFVYKAQLTTLPQLKIGEIKKIKVKRRKPEIKEEDIEKLLTELRISRRKEILVDRPAQKGDRLVIDLEMFLNGVPLEGGQGKHISYLLGESYYIPGLEEKLIGLKKGEIKEFSLEYPVNFYDKKLAGKTIDFKVKVHSIYQIELPNLDDSFAQSLGNFKNLKELREQLKLNLEEEAKIKEEERLELEILNKLIEISIFEGEIPEILIEEEKEKMILELEESLERMNLKFDDYLIHLKKTREELKESFSSQAIKRVKTNLIIRKIIQENNIFISDEELEKAFNDMIEYYKYDLEAQKNIKTDEYRNYLRNVLLNRKVIEFLKKQVIIE